VPTISATYTTIAGTEASEGRAGERAVVADRPAGVAGGRGLGFNGGELLALAVGGCLCNDLRYAAHRDGDALGPFEIRVHVDIGHDGAIERVRVEIDAGDDRARIAGLIDETVAASTIVRAVANGAPVDVTLGESISA